VGYLAQTFDDPRFDMIDGIDFGGKVVWNVTRRTTVSALVGRHISVTTLDNAAGSLVTEAGVTVDHELRRDLLLHFNAKWRENDYSGIDRTDDTYEIGAGVNYFITRNFNVGAGYSYRQRSSNAPTAEYMRNLVMLNLDLRF
jgi:outer membrane autotransporter protein